MGRIFSKSDNEKRQFQKRMPDIFQLSNLFQPDSTEPDYVELLREVHHELTYLLEPDYGLIDTLYSDKLITSEQLVEIRSQQSVFEKNKKLLDILAECSHEKIGLLLKDLKICDQLHIANFIEGKDDGDRVPLTKSTSTAIRINFPEIVDQLPADNAFMDKLRPIGCFTSTQLNALQQMRDTYEKRRRLIDILTRRSQENFRNFVEFLRDDQPHIGALFTEKTERLVRDQANYRRILLSQSRSTLSRSLPALHRTGDEDDTYKVGRMLHPTEMVALGRKAVLGELYNIYSDSFLEITVINDKIRKSESAVLRKSARWTSIKLISSDTYQEKFSKAKLPQQIQLTVLTQREKFSGCGAFLNSQEIGQKATRVTVMCNFHTSVEAFNPNFAGKLLPKNYFSSRTIRRHLDIATHVVVGVYRGACYFLSVEKNSVDGNSCKDVELNLRTALTDLADAVDQNREVTSETLEVLQDENLKWTLHSDFPKSPMFAMPATFYDIERYLKSNRNELTKQTAEIPVNYVLLPLSDLQENTRLSLVRDNDAGQEILAEHQLTKLVMLFDDNMKVQQRLSDLLVSMNNRSSFFSPTEMTHVGLLLAYVKDGCRSFGINVSKATKFVTSAEERDVEVENAIGAYHANKKGAFEIENDTLLTQMENHLVLIEQCETVGIQYVRGEKYSPKMLTDKHYVYVLYYNGDATNSSNVLFFELAKRNHQRPVAGSNLNAADTPHFVCVNCTSNEVLARAEGSNIKYYRRGQCIYSDVSSECQLNLARSNSQYIASKISESSTKLKLECPGTILGKCQQQTEEALQWHCAECRKCLYLVDDNYISCDCGIAPSKTFEFRCQHVPLHPIDVYIKIKDSQTLSIARGEKS